MRSKPHRNWRQSGRTGVRLAFGLNITRNLFKKMDVHHHVANRGWFDTIHLKNPVVRLAHLLVRHLFLTKAFRSELKYLDLVKILAVEHERFLRLRGAAWICRPVSGGGSSTIGS